MLNITLRQRCHGCLLGGAVGDALGAPVEFMTYSQIVARFGPNGIRDFAPAYGRLGAITDDTQMTLFTAEGLLRAHVRLIARGICNPVWVIHQAYLRWLQTQDQKPGALDSKLASGWLVRLPALWSRRAPGNTCLSALRNAAHLMQPTGAPAQNNSKGCGGVMRVAPVGLVARRDLAFTLGCQVAALTHGHPSGILSAGFLAMLIAEIVAGSSLRAAIEAAKSALIAEPDHSEILRAIETAEELAASPATMPIPAALGAGWVAEEAVAIALYCTLAGSSFEEAVVLAVNHSGDSDSTGAITGNICGALQGADVIPDRWLGPLELRDEIRTIAGDLATFITEERNETIEQLWERYPGG